MVNLHIFDFLQSNLNKNQSFERLKNKTLPLPLVIPSMCFSLYLSVQKTADPAKINRNNLCFNLMTIKKNKRPGSAVVLWFQNHEDTVFFTILCVWLHHFQESHPSSVLINNHWAVTTVKTACKEAHSEHRGFEVFLNVNTCIDSLHGQKVECWTRKTYQLPSNKDFLYIVPYKLVLLYDFYK